MSAENESKSSTLEHVANPGEPASSSQKAQGSKQGRNIYSCKICKLKFTFLSKWKGHNRIHTKEKPFVCTVCEKGFSENSSLKEHLQTLHNTQRDHKCPICKSGFRSSKELRRHLKDFGSMLKDCKLCAFDCSHVILHCKNTQINKLPSRIRTRLLFTRNQDPLFRCEKCARPFSCQACQIHNTYFSFDTPASSRAAVATICRYCPLCSKTFLKEPQDDSDNSSDTESSIAPSASALASSTSYASSSSSSSSAPCNNLPGNETLKSVPVNCEESPWDLTWHPQHSIFIDTGTINLAVRRDPRRAISPQRKANQVDFLIASSLKCPQFS